MALHIRVAAAVPTARSRQAEVPAGHLLLLRRRVVGVRSIGGVGVGVGVGGRAVGAPPRATAQQQQQQQHPQPEQHDQHWALATPYDADERALVERLLAAPLDELMADARRARDALWPGDAAPSAAAARATPPPLPLLPRPVTFSPKVFIPLTRACADRCGYCTFAAPPVPGRRLYMTLDEVAAVARAGVAQGCTEALLTLGDAPERAWPEARHELAQMGFSSTLAYVEAACARVLAETGALPHVNAGLVDAEWARRLKRVSASQGLMLEGVDPALRLPGAAHDASTCPDKDPRLRLRAIEAAGEARVPFTTGILVGIGESRAERLRALVAVRRLHARHGHVQELIVQNFRAKAGTAMARWAEPPLEELLWSVACARLVLPPDVSVQAPPNLTPPVDAGGSELRAPPSSSSREAAAAAGSDDNDVDDNDSNPPTAAQEAALAAAWRALLGAGINDWGGVSPLTRDWVNPEKPWPHLGALARATGEAAGRPLLPRLPVYPRYAVWQMPPSPAAALAGGGGDGGGGSGGEQEGWLSEEGGFYSVAAAVRRLSDGSGLSRGLGGWFAGVPDAEDGAEEEEGRTGEAQEAAAQQQRHEQQQQDQQKQQQPGGGALPATAGDANKRPAPGGLLLPVARGGGGGGWAVALDAYGGTLAGLPPPADVTPALRSLLQRLLDPERDEREAQHARRWLSSGVGGGGGVGAREVEALLSARGADAEAVRAAADALRRRVCGDDVTYVVNRNINYTNVCSYACTFCGFSKARPGEEDGEGKAPSASASAATAAAATAGERDPPYLVPLDEVSRRAREAWDRGATEVCMQGGIHPRSTGETYLSLVRAAKKGAPDIHVHAFSPLEISHGAATLGLPLVDYLRDLRAAGLGSLPGTAAEILDADVRRAICPDKLSAEEWEGVMMAAAEVAAGEQGGGGGGGGGGERGAAPTSRPPFRATSTMMFGHVEHGPYHQARHLLRLRDLQVRTGGLLSEFVPLPYVHPASPAYLRGHARRGPTLREAMLAHSAARLALHPHVTHIQASWVKMGPRRAAAALLRSGCDDMGGVLMSESITRASGAAHGQALPPREMERRIRSAGGAGGDERRPVQRTTLYGAPDPGQVARSLSDAGEAPLAPVVKVAAARGLAAAGF